MSQGIANNCRACVWVVSSAGGGGGKTNAVRRRVSVAQELVAELGGTGAAKLVSIEDFALAFKRRQGDAAENGAAVQSAAA